MIQLRKVVVVSWLVSVGCARDSQPQESPPQRQSASKQSNSDLPDTAFAELGQIADIILHDGASPVAFPIDVDLWQGHIVVTDGSQDNLKRFDRAGNLVGVIGASGSGPGEFRFPAASTVVGDSAIAVLDPINQRITTFSASGAVLSTIRINSPRAISLHLFRGDFLVGGETAEAGGRMFMRYATDGTPRGSFGGPVVVRSRIERSVMSVRAAPVGDLVAIATTTSNRITLFRGQEQVRTIEVARAWYEPWEFPTPEPRTQQESRAWSRTQMWVDALLPIDSIRFATCFTQQKQPGQSAMFRCAIVDLAREREWSSQALPVPIQLIRSDTAYSVSIDNNGRTRLRIFHLQLN